MAEGPSAHNNAAAARDARADLEAMNPIGLPGDFEQRMIEAKWLAVAGLVGDELVGTKAR